MDINFIKITDNIFLTDTGNYNHIDIYFFHKYFNWDYAKQFPPNDIRHSCSSRILNFKSGDHYVFGWYRSGIKKRVLKSFSSEKWVVCSIPLHDQIVAHSNNTDNFIKFCKLPSNFTCSESLILKINPDIPKHLPEYGNRSMEKDLLNFKLTSKVNGLNILVIDDVSTSGSSLAAAYRLLKNNGANKVICLALAKTSGRPIY